MKPGRANLRIGVVGIADGWSTRCLLEAVAARAAEAHLIDLARAQIDVNRRQVWLGDLELTRLDAIIVKKLADVYTPDHLDRLETLRFIENASVPVFSSPAKMLALLDRLSCTLRLAEGGIPMPPTLVTADPTAAVAAIERFGAAVLKPLYSTKARGMRVVRAGGDVRGAVAEFHAAGNPTIYVQKLMPLPGRDLGIALLGGQVIASYARVAGSQTWNTCIANGGRYLPVEPDHAILDLARRAAALFGLDFTGVDIAETPDGLLVFEVSAFGGFRGLRDAHGIDAGALYAEYVLRKLEPHGHADAG